MTLITPDEEKSDIGSAITALERQLSGMREDLEEIQHRLRAEDAEALANSGRMLTEVKQWLRFAIETEVKLEQRNKREKGIVNGYALDLDTARTSIGCRLGRIRRTCGAGRVSGRDGDG